MTYRLKTLAVVIGLSLLASCAAARKATFNAADFEPYTGTGTARLVGQAFLKTRGGDVKLAAGNTISLVPVTPYTQEWFDQVNTHRITPGSADPREARYTRTTMGDAGANFEFPDLPAGDYYLYCTITWMKDGGGDTGGLIVQPVHLDPGQTKKVILTR